MIYDHLLRADNRYERELTAEEAFRIASFGREHSPCRTMMPGLNLSVWKAWLDADVAASVWRPAKPMILPAPDFRPRSVRQWFRELRAADFERDISWSPRPLQWSGAPWTLFDTMKVVDRETAAFYLRPKRDELFFCYGGRVVGKIEDIDWSGTPALLMDVEPTHRDEYLGIDRSVYPMFSSKVESARARGITIEDIRAFVNDDDARRPERRRRGAGW
jgi:hypothetical protein